MDDTNVAIRNNDYQQVLLAALFGVLTTILAVASVVVGYLQLRKHRLANAVADVENGVDAISLAEVQADAAPSPGPNTLASEQQVNRLNTDTPMPSEGDL